MRQIQGIIYSVELAATLNSFHTTIVKVSHRMRDVLHYVHAW